MFFTVFPTDQSEAKLLYFCSLFFSVKKAFQKTKVCLNRNTIARELFLTKIPLPVCELLDACIELISREPQGLL
jgi:hypothetical protein